VVIETCTFRLAAGVDEDEFLRADQHVQTELYSPQPGFLRRTTARGETGEWIVVTLWATAPLAEACDALAGDDPAWRTFDALVEPSTVDRRRYLALD